MKDFRSMAFVIFADIAFQLCNGLAAGYYFVTLKEQEAKHAESGYFKEKGIDVPRLEDGTGSDSLTNDHNSLEISVPKVGGQFIIDGKTVQKSDLDNILKNQKDNTCVVSIDQDARSGDTLYLFDVLNKYYVKIKIVYLGDK